MNHIDYKYILLIGGQLDRFKDVGNGVYTFRCPICGDSKKKADKVRGNIFGKDKPRFMCYNCGSSSTLASFIKHLNPSLFLQYKLERFKTSSSNKQTPTNDHLFVTPGIQTKFQKVFFIVLSNKKRLINMPIYPF